MPSCIHAHRSQNIVEGDGGCFSRMKDAKGIKGIVRQLSDGSTMTETKKSIVIRSIPNGDKPGKMEILGSSAIVREMCACAMYLW